MTIEESRARELLEPHHPYFAHCVLEAWEKYARLVAAPLRASVCSRTQANVLWDLMSLQAEDSLPFTAGLNLTRKDNSMFITIGDDLIVRLKKLGGSGHSSNYQTALQMDYRDQVQIPGILGSLPRVDVGYTLDPTGMSFDSILVAMPGRRRAKWSYTIPAQMAADFHGVQADPSAMPQPVIVRRRRHLQVLPGTGTESK